MSSERPVPRPRTVPPCASHTISPEVDSKSPRRRSPRAEELFHRLSQLRGEQLREELAQLDIQRSQRSSNPHRQRNRDRRYSGNYQSPPRSNQLRLRVDMTRPAVRNRTVSSRSEPSGICQRRSLQQPRDRRLHLRKLRLDHLRGVFFKNPVHIADYSLDASREVQLGRQSFKYFVYGSAQQIDKPDVEFDLNVGYETFDPRPLDEGLTSICNFLMKYYSNRPAVTLRQVSFFICNFLYI